ncbi:MAG TPA: hypothetical protein VNZ52_16805, partial [Candidatus Thermoplasmatota archaeon]|nr:hypothetical protein [Candidatus Thermoplasmatota archaeon]
SCAAYLMVGNLTLKRQVGPDARLANTLFAVWWFCLGVQSFVQAGTLAYAAFAVPDYAFMVTKTYVGVITLVAALWALMYYLLYLYTGKASLLGPLTATYGLLTLLFMYTVSWLHPIGVERTAWSVRTLNENALTAGPALLVIFAFVIPVLVATVAYGSLFFRLKDPSQRYRVGLVSGAFLAWFGWALLVSLMNVATGTKQPPLGIIVVSRLFGLIVPLLIVLAYRPPRWIRERLTGPGSAPAAA